MPASNHPDHPPRVCERLFQRMFPDNGGGSTLGDLAEVFQSLVLERGRRRARFWYRRQLLRAVPAFLRDQISWRAAMLANYLKIAFRNIRRQKAYSFINIAGLAIGMACTMLILLWIRDELSYDRFHEKREDIYRVVSRGTESDFFGSPAPFAPTIEQEIPEVLEAVRVQQTFRFMMKYEEKAFYEDSGLVADPAFLKMFTFPMIMGDPETALSQPFNIVMSESMARRYFGGADPLGRTLILEGRAPLKITGVLRDIPANSHMRFDFILPYRFSEVVGFWGKEWGDFNFRTYLLAAPARDVSSLPGKLTEVARSHGCPQVVHGELTFDVQPLEEIWLNPVGAHDIPLGDKRYVYLFTVIAVLILVIACINFINLATARSERRAREVGLRKVVGARRIQVIRQFFGESILLAVLAMAFAALLVKALMPEFNRLTGKVLTFTLFDPVVFLGLLGVALAAGVVAGAYPALVLSSFQPVFTLRGGSSLTSAFNPRAARFAKQGGLRRVLVVIQFGMSVALIIATATVYHQLRFIRQMSWTLKKDVIVHIPFKENIAPKYDVVREELLMHPDIVAVGAQDSLPTAHNNYTSGVGWEGKTDAQSGIYFETTRVDFHYLETMGIRLEAGRGFSPEYPGDAGSAFVLNREAVRLAELTDPVGQMFRLYDKRGPIVGVVEDTYFQTMRQELRGRVYHLFENLPREAFNGAALIRIRGGTGRSPAGALAHIEAVWKDVNRAAPFEYHFLDETIDALYRGERRLGRLFGYFAFLAVFVSCLGLFGLAAFLAERRTKEIGIRKALGASSGQIAKLLSKEFLVWVAVANLIAWPAVGFAMRRWLLNFPYRTSLPWWIFAAAGGLSLIVAWLSVTLQTWRSARTDPVAALKYE